VASSLKFQSSRVSEFQSSRVPEFQSFKVSKYQGAESSFSESGGALWHSVTLALCDSGTL